MSNLDFRSTPGIGDDDRQLVIRPAGRDSISVKVGNQTEIVVDADELQRLVESAFGDCAKHVTTAETCMGCDTNGGHYDWCQGADPELEDAVTELPGESRKGDTAGPLREWIDPGRNHAFEVRPGWAIWADSRQEAVALLDRNEPGYGCSVDDLLAHHRVTEVPPAQSGEATA